MSAVRRWNLLVRAVLVSVAILVLGVGAFRTRVIEDQRVALWPTFELLHLENLEGPQPLPLLLQIAAVQIAVWTLIAFLVFYGLDSLRHGARRS